jgi:putative addiction module component (TIGR02574 family)
MTATFNSVLQYALQLPVVERSRIATRLIESVDDTDDDAEVSPEWQAEINRRIESIQNGTAKLIPHEEVMAGLHHKLAQQRAAKSA